MSSGAPAGTQQAEPLALRYNFRDGNDLWVVYNEGLNTEHYRFAPSLPFTESRALLVKYTYTFQP